MLADTLPYVSTALDLGGRDRDDADENLLLALFFAERGWKVFPCGANKTPAIPSAHPEGDPQRRKCRGECGQDGHGYHDATTDPAKIATWWKRYPGALVGLACAPSGLWVLDFDRPGPSHPHSADGVESFKKLAAENHADTKHNGPMQRTPGGGYHLVFMLPSTPADFEMPGQLAPGIDIKYNGYICSGRLPDGRAYQWQPEHEFYTPLTYPPGWIIHLVNRLNKKAIAEQAAKERAAEAAKAKRAATPGGAMLPGDDYKRKTWGEVLTECLPGWFIDGGKPDTDYVYRKDKGHGLKATIHKDILYIFAENGLPGCVKSRTSYNKFSLYVDTHHNGDFKAAARALSATGYGSRER